MGWLWQWDFRGWGLSYVLEVGLMTMDLIAEGAGGIVKEAEEPDAVLGRLGGHERVCVCVCVEGDGEKGFLQSKVALALPFKREGLLERKRGSGLIAGAAVMDVF